MVTIARPIMLPLIASLYFIVFIIIFLLLILTTLSQNEIGCSEFVDEWIV